MREERRSEAEARKLALGCEPGVLGLPGARAQFLQTVLCSTDIFVIVTLRTELGSAAAANMGPNGPDHERAGCSEVAWSRVKGDAAP